MGDAAGFRFRSRGVWPICRIGHAGRRFSSIGASMSDPAREGSRGYAWFRLFMGGVGIASAVTSWLMLRGKLGPLDDAGDE